MSLGILFWIIFLIALIFGIPQVNAKVPAWSSNLIFWILVGILGWAVFGQPVHS